MEIRFGPREYNPKADMLSRWGRKVEEGDKKGKERGRIGEEGCKDELRVEPSRVEDMLGEYMWNMLHTRHVGVRTMVHRKKSWGLHASKG